VARITLPSGTPAELARPDDDQLRAFGLVVAPDIFGLRPLFDDHVARLSHEQGWSVVAVEPFPGQTFAEGDVDARFAAASQLDDERVLGDLVSAAEALGASRVGLIGFCMGGMYALKAASTGAFDRACAFYGMIRVPVTWRGTGQGEPLEHLARRSPRTQVMAVIGAEDPYTPPEDVEALRATGAEVVIYPEENHGLVHDPSRPAHRPDDAADAWARCLAFLRG
jgi:carboxymethylenebutenolidase